MSLDTLPDGVDTAADYLVAESYDGYTTRLPLHDVTGGKAWVVNAYDGFALSPEHGRPARLLVPYLYCWRAWCACGAC
ncbi:molybdopterin-dependent oxidoreductase [Streptomyces sp. SAS_281]|uniref:molybdopterin-dependent oxidoreductase n=1 Tax=Streptomyces sp. SAS_281 TaxID=3412744 RepID=UPI00403C6B5B